MSIYYTYAWLREDRTPFYIGKGHGNRAYDQKRKSCPPKDRILILKQNLTEEEAFKHEIYMISIFGRKDLNTGCLINCTNGGEGTSGVIRSDEWRKNHSEFMKLNNPMKHLKREDHSEYMRKNNPMKSEEAKEKIRQARLKEKIECPYCGKLNNSGNNAKHILVCKLRK